jgi:hypothetical protein
VITTVVLHAAAMLLEQAQPQTLYTQIVNYNPPKALQSKNFVFTVLGYSLKSMVCEIEGLCFEFWSLVAVLDKRMVWRPGYTILA